MPRRGGLSHNATLLEVTDIKHEPTRLHLHRTKGQKERYVPLPEAMLQELRAYWRTHRHPRWICGVAALKGTHSATPKLRFGAEP